MSQAEEEPADVACYSGYTYAQEPRAFTVAGQRYEVTSVDHRGRTPHGRTFSVTATLHPYPEDERRTESDFSEVDVPKAPLKAERHANARWQLTYDEAQDKWYARHVTLEEEVDGERTRS